MVQLLSLRLLTVTVLRRCGYISLLLPFWSRTWRRHLFQWNKLFSLWQQLHLHYLVLYFGVASKRVAFESVGDYLFGWIFGISTLLWPINSHSLLTHIKMQSAFVRYNSHSIVLESKAKKKITGFGGKKLATILYVTFHTIISHRKSSLYSLHAE